MKKFLRSLYVFIRLYKMGYNWSGLFSSEGGFFRLNYLKNDQKEYAVIDIDFADKDPHTFSHIHGGRENSTIFRVDNNEITVSSKPSFDSSKWGGK